MMRPRKRAGESEEQFQARLASFPVRPAHMNTVRREDETDEQREARREYERRRRGVYIPKGTQRRAADDPLRRPAHIAHTPREEETDEQRAARRAWETIRKQPKRMAVRMEREAISLTQRQNAFEVWYRTDRSFPAAARETGIKEYTIRQWGHRYNWPARANERDLEVERIAARRAIRRKAEMLERHRRAGELMVMRATQFFRNGDSAQTPIERSADAINAMKAGIDIERTAESLPAWVFELLEADDATLATIVRQVAADQDATDWGSGGEDHPATQRGELLLADGQPVTGNVEWENNGSKPQGSGNDDASEYEEYEASEL
jgi:hypothetical protein